jgi:hypothetical protein
VASDTRTEDVDDGASIGGFRLTYERIVIAILVAAVLSCTFLFLGYLLSDLGDEPRNLYCRPTTVGDVEGLVICSEDFPTE